MVFTKTRLVFPSKFPTKWKLCIKRYNENTFELLAKNYPLLEIYSYDICNELFINDGGGMRPAGNSRWVLIYGDDFFVINAFTYARKYCFSKL